VVSFCDLLNRLTAYLLPKGKSLASSQLEQVAPHSILADVATCHPIISPLQGDRVVPDDTRYINPVHQMFIAPIVVQAIFQCFPDFHYDF
jgi:hypothetical protein